MVTVCTNRSNTRTTETEKKYEIKEAKKRKKVEQ